MKTPSVSFNRLLIVMLPLICVVVSGLVLLKEGGEAAGEKSIPAVQPASRLEEVSPAFSGVVETPDEITSGSAVAAAGTTGRVAAASRTAQAGMLPVQGWKLRADPLPVSHWAPGTGGPAPQRSGRLEGGLEDLEKAVAGTPVEFSLFDGLTAQGIVRRAVETAPGDRLWSGKLSHPAGNFFIEHNRTGWRGTLTFKGRPEAYRILPGTAGNEGPWLERWAREEIECAQVGGSEYDPVSPALDPGIDASNLQSRPGAPRVIYLDFNGGWIDNTYWNSSYNEDERINFATSNLSVDDRVRAWAHAAEDFKAFNVNVTNVKSLYDAAGSGNRVYVVITPTKSWYGDDPDEEVTAKGGVSEVGSYGSSGCVAWVWNNTWLSAGDTISHEAGHALGLYHSGYYNIVENDFRKYYHGHGEGSAGWAPIMGVGFDDPSFVTTWDNGSYPWASSDQNQKAVLGGVLGGVPDDHGDSTAAATTLPPEGAGPVFKGSGRLDAAADVDFFRLQLPAGTWAFQTWGNRFGRNVNLTIQVRNGLNEVLDETDWADSPDATSALQLPAGTYYLTIRSTVRPESDADPGYPRYGQLGTYSIFVLPFGYEPTPPTADYQSIAKFELGTGSADLQVKYEDETLVDTATLGNGDVLMQRGSSPAISGQLVSHSGTGRERYATYRFDAPGPDWDIGEGGSYRFFVPANAVKDDWGNGILETTLVTRVLPDSDPNPPSVTLPNGLGNGTEGDTEYSFRVAVADIAPVTVSENGRNCVEVRRVTAGETLFTGIAVTAAWDGASSSNYNKNWTMDYTYTPPGGVWDESDIGEYEVRLRAGKVRDVNGNITPAKKLGSFFLRKKLWERTFDESGAVAIWARDAGWAFGEPQGTGGYWHDPASAYSGNNVLGYRLGSGDAALYEHNLTTVRYATSPAINVSGYSRIFLQFQRSLSIEAGDDVLVQASRDGNAWTTVWRNPEDEGIFDGDWTRQEIELPAAIADNATGLKFRFGLGTTNDSHSAGGWTIDNVKLIAGGLFNPGRLILNNVSSRVTEGAAFNALYTVRLDQAPISPVTVEIDPGTQLATSRSSIIFTSLNWFTPVNVLLSAVDDVVVEGERLTGLTHRISSTETDPAFAGVRTSHLVTVVDDESPLIETQPEDKAVAAGQSAVFRVVPFSTSLKGYQWYFGNSGDTSNPISGGTASIQSIQLPAGSTQPVAVWVRVRVNVVGGSREDSETALLSPLRGYAAWKSLLKNHGYSNDDLAAGGFDAADPDRDGLGHFMEYAFGGQPYTADQALLPRVSLERSAGTGEGLIGLSGTVRSAGGYELALTFGAPKPDVRYTTEISPDLERWQVFKSSTSATTTLPGRLSPGSTIIRIPLDPGGHLFARVLAEYVAP